jgi:hypothetical protein
MSKFTDTLPDRVAKEMMAARLSPEAMSDVLEVLTKSLGTTIAIMAAGDQKRVEHLLAGIEIYILEQAVAMSKWGRAIASMSP